MNELCECCGERPIDKEAKEHGYDLCVICSQDSTCSICDREATEPHLVWEEGLCSNHKKTNDVSQWAGETIAKIRDAAEANGWQADSWPDGSIGSNYICLERGDERFEVRVSDHRICSPVMRSDPDYSIEYSISDTAHDISNVIARLQNESKHN